MVNTNAIDSIQCGSDADADAASVDNNNNVAVVEKELTSCEQKQKHSPAETEQSLSEDDEELPSTSTSQLQLTITHSSLEDDDESAVEVEVNEPTAAVEMSEAEATPALGSEVADCIEDIVEATSTSASAAVVSPSKECSAEEGSSAVGELQHQESSMAPVGENASASDDSADIDRQVQVHPTALEAATDVTTLSADEQSNASYDGTASSTQCTKSNGGSATHLPLIESEPEIGETPSISISNQQKQSTPQNISVLDDTLFDGISDEEDEDRLESASIILSDAGESKCASTAPVINWSVSGEEVQDEKLMALGVFVARAAHTDDTDGEPPTANQGADNSQPCVDDGSAAAEGKDENTNESNTTGEPGPTLKDTEVTTAAIASPRLLSPIQTVPEDGEATHIVEGNAPSVSPSKSMSTSNPPSPNSSYSSPNGYDKKRLNERLKQRLAKRAASGGSSPTKISDDKGGSNSPTSKPTRDTSRSRAQWETRLQAATRSKRRYHKSSSQHDVSSNDTNEDGSKSDILSRYNRSATDIIEGEKQKSYPDTVTFSDGEEQEQESSASSSTTRPGLRIDTKIASRDCRTAYRKCASEAGASLSLSTRASRSKLSRHHHPHHHGIGILQADGIVYDDAMLLRLARQARYGRLRGEVAVSSNAAAKDGNSAVGERRMNEVKIHVYDLLMKDAMVEMPYFNCNFPIGQCFKAVNDGCHMLGTGAYHVGVEVSMWGHFCMCILNHAALCPLTNDLIVHLCRSMV